MATPKSLTEWLERLGLLANRIQICKAAISGVLKLEGAAGKPGAIDWPIDYRANGAFHPANDIMYNDLATLDSEMDTIMASSYFYLYDITEGRPVAFTKAHVFTYTVSEAAPRTLIVANGGYGVDPYPFAGVNPQGLYGVNYTDHVSVLCGDHEYLAILGNGHQVMAIYQTNVNGIPTLPAIANHERGIIIEGLDCLRPLTMEEYWSFQNPHVIKDRCWYYRAGQAWCELSTLTEDLVQYGVNMRNPTIADMTYEVSFEIVANGNTHAGSVIRPYLMSSDDTPEVDIGRGWVDLGVMHRNIGIHLFYITAPSAANMGDMSDLRFDVMLTPEIIIDWIHMMPMWGQHVANGRFYSCALLHDLDNTSPTSSTNPLSVLVDYHETERWMMPVIGLTAPNGAWYMCVDYYRASTSGVATNRILYQSEAKLARPLLKDTHYTVEFTILNYVSGMIQPAIGKVHDGTLLSDPWVDGFSDGFGVAVPGEGQMSVTYRQVIKTGNPLVGYEGDLAFIPRKDPAGLYFNGDIKDVIVSQYYPDGDDTEHEPETHVKLIDRA